MANGRRHVILGGGQRRTGGEASAGTPEYRAWQAMIRRCHDDHAKDFPRYGGRGIRVCDAWRVSFTAFLAEIGRKPSPSHSVDRIDGVRGYEPGNVRWATSKEQARNRRSNRNLTVGGVTKTLAEWAELAGIRRDTLARRIIRGWSVEDAVKSGDYRSRSHS